MPMTGMAGYKFAIVVSALDCTGCGSCANVCPGKKGAESSGYGEHGEQTAGMQAAFDYAVTLPEQDRCYREVQRDYCKGISVQDSRCLSSQAHAQAAVRLRTQN